MEDDPTLEEIVNFIESCDQISYTTTSDSEDGGSPMRLSAIPLASPDPQDGVGRDAPKSARPTTKTPGRKARKKAPGASTRLQRRKKAEILALREQSQSLERQVEVIKHSIKEAPAQSSGGAMQTWFEIAALQYQQRLKSEMVNQNLRSLLADQLLRKESLRALFEKRNISWQTQEAIQRPLGFDCTLGLIDELERMTDILYLKSGTMLEAYEQSFGVSLNLNVQHGKGFEIVSITPTTYSMDEAASLVWNDSFLLRAYNDKSFRFLRQRLPWSVEKNFLMLLQNGAISREVNGFSFARKVEESNRVVFVESHTFLLPTNDLRFRMQSWTVVASSQTPQCRTSTVRSVIRLFPECQDDFVPFCEDQRVTEELVFDTLSKRVLNFYKGQQNKLVCDVAAASVNFCPHFQQT